MIHPKFINFLLPCILLLLVGTACGSDKQLDRESQDSNSTATETQQGAQLLTIKTSLGNIELELNSEKAPATVENFLSYVRDGHYNGTIFHRVIPGFMIQGGGFESGLKLKPTNAPILNEANNGLLNEEFTIAMARTGDPHSATSQFFINVRQNNSLNFSSETTRGWGYTVFGKVIDGQDIVKLIEAVKTRSIGQYGDVPLEDVVIESISLSQ